MNDQKKSPHGNVGFNSTLVSGSSPLEIILNRLDGVRKSLRGFTAKCPAHADRTASLSISEADTGNALIHCFAGCPVVDVLQAIGLELSALYPKRISVEMTPQERSQARQWARLARFDAAINALILELEVVIIGARKAIAGTLTFEDLERMVVALQRFLDAKVVLNGR